MNLAEKLLYFIWSKIYRRIHHKLQVYVGKPSLHRYFLSLFKKEDLHNNILTKEEKLEIDNFYKKHYGKKVSYMWHNLFKKCSGKFDVRYIPVDIFIEYLFSLNLISNQWDILKDKNFLYNIAKSVDVKIPKKICCSINGIFFDSNNKIVLKDKFYELISNLGEAFIKPTQIHNTGYARNCRMINIVNGIDIYSKTKIEDIISKYYDKDFVIQETIICHKSISDLYPNTVNTIALSTIILNNEIKVLKPVLKIGMDGNIVDFSGFNNKGLMIPVKEDGTLYDKAYCLSEHKYYFKHPDTGVVFKNYKIDLFPKILEAAKKIQSTLPYLPICGMDFVLDKNGDAIVIEIEEPSCHIGQILYGEGHFGENTERILSFLKDEREKSKLL